MKKQKQTAHADSVHHSGQGRKPQQHDGQSPKEKQERKDCALTEGTSSMVRDIADAIVVKDQNIFFLTNQDGNVRGSTALHHVYDTERLRATYMALRR